MVNRRGTALKKWTSVSLATSLVLPSISIGGFNQALGVSFGDFVGSSWLGGSGWGAVEFEELFGVSYTPFGASFAHTYGVSYTQEFINFVKDRLGASNVDILDKIKDFYDRFCLGTSKAEANMGASLDAGLHKDILNELKNKIDELNSSSIAYGLSSVFGLSYFKDSYPDVYDMIKAYIAVIDGIGLEEHEANNAKYLEEIKDMIAKIQATAETVMVEDPFDKMKALLDLADDIVGFYVILGAEKNNLQTDIQELETYKESTEYKENEKKLNEWFADTGLKLMVIELAKEANSSIAQLDKYIQEEATQRDGFVSLLNEKIEAIEPIMRTTIRDDMDEDIKAIIPELQTAYVRLTNKLEEIKGKVDIDTQKQLYERLQAAYDVDKIVNELKLDGFREKTVIELKDLINKKITRLNTENGDLYTILETQINNLNELIAEIDRVEAEIKKFDEENADTLAKLKKLGEIAKCKEDLESVMQGLRDAFDERRTEVQRLVDTGEIADLKSIIDSLPEGEAKTSIEAKYNEFMGYIEDNINGREDKYNDKEAEYKELLEDETLSYDDKITGLSECLSELRSYVGNETYKLDINLNMLKINVEIGKYDADQWLMYNEVEAKLAEVEEDIEELKNSEAKEAAEGVYEGLVADFEEYDVQLEEKFAAQQTYFESKQTEIESLSIDEQLNALEEFLAQLKTDLEAQVGAEETKKDILLTRIDISSEMMKWDDSQWSLYHEAEDKLDELKVAEEQTEGFVLSWYESKKGDLETFDQWLEKTYNEKLGTFADLVNNEEMSDTDKLGELQGFSLMIKGYIEGQEAAERAKADSLIKEIEALIVLRLEGCIEYYETLIEATMARWQAGRLGLYNEANNKLNELRVVINGLLNEDAKKRAEEVYSALKGEIVAFDAYCQSIYDEKASEIEAFRASIAEKTDKDKNDELEKYCYAELPYFLYGYDSEPAYQKGILIYKIGINSEMIKWDDSQWSLYREIEAKLKELSDSSSEKAALKAEFETFDAKLDGAFADKLGEYEALLTEIETLSDAEKWQKIQSFLFRMEADAPYQMSAERYSADSLIAKIDSAIAAWNASLSSGGSSGGGGGFVNPSPSSNGSSTSATSTVTLVETTDGDIKEVDGNGQPLSGDAESAEENRGLIKTIHKKFSDTVVSAEIIKSFNKTTTEETNKVQAVIKNGIELMLGKVKDTVKALTKKDPKLESIVTTVTSVSEDMSFNKATLAIDKKHIGKKVYISWVYETGHDFYLTQVYDPEKKAMVMTWKEYDENTTDVGGITLESNTFKTVNIDGKEHYLIPFVGIQDECAIVVTFAE